MSKSEIEYYYDSSVITYNRGKVECSVREIVLNIQSQTLSVDNIFESNACTHSTTEQTNPKIKTVSVEVGRYDLWGNNFSIRLCQEFKGERDSSHWEFVRNYYLAKISRKNKS